MAEPRRWERVREHAPGWLDLNHWPWWLFALLALAGLCQGLLFLFVRDRSLGNLLDAAVTLLVFVPGLAVGARRRYRGEPYLVNRARR